MQFVPVAVLEIGKSARVGMSKACFLHDADARVDEKILTLRVNHGWEGYGLYWAIIELMRGATEHKLRIDAVGALALGLGGIDSAKLSAVIDTGISVGLFEKEAGHFFSPSLCRRMDQMKNISDIRRKAVDARWKKDKKKRHVRCNTNVLQAGEFCNTEQNRTEKNGIEENRNILGGESERGASVQLAERIRVTTAEHEKLISEFGVDALSFYGPICSDWLAANGRVKKDYAAFLRNWIRKDKAESKGFYTVKPGFYPSRREREIQAIKDQLAEARRNKTSLIEVKP